MSTASEIFPYPLLPSGVDAIRILTLDPGDFADSLTGTLASAAFSSKPKYVALSYTWRDSYPDNAALVVGPPQAKQSPAGTQEHHGNLMITLNGYPFNVQHNLYLFMLHLRSPTHKLTVWVDAICINQADTKERNSQVTLMSFIYSRALKVVAWLGVKAYGNKVSLFQCMSSDWKAGQVRPFASSLADATKIRYSLEPDGKTFARITESAYWVRIWVVQEVCLPRLLVFVYGSKIWSSEDLNNWEVLKAARAKRLLPGISRDASNDGFEAMLRLLDTRGARHTDATRLENLIETFALSGCVELRDRVYGLLGFSNDAFPFSGRDDNGMSDPSSPERLDLGIDSVPESRIRLRSFKVDYSRSFYTIWTDVVEFVYFQAECMNGRFRNEELCRWKPDPGSIVEVERCISIVRTAGIAQEAFGQMLENEMANGKLPEASHNYHLVFKLWKPSEINMTKQLHKNPVIRALGYLSGTIIHLGPEYSSLIGSFRAQQDWVNCWRDYNQDIDVETVRTVNEKYYAKIVDYDDKDLARIRALSSPSAVGWYFGGGGKPEVKLENTLDDEQNLSKEVRICLGTDNQIAIVPSVAKVGDVIVRFWNCDAAILMRPIYPTRTASDATIARYLETGSISADQDARHYFFSVGRADVAETSDRKENLGFDLYAEECLSRSALPDRISRGVNLEMDLRTLQAITNCIST